MIAPGDAVALHGVGKVTLWDTGTRQELATLKEDSSDVRAVTFSGHSDVVQSVAFSPDGRTLASASADGVKLWDISTRQELATFKGASAPVAFSPDGRTLASDSSDKTVRLYIAATKEEVAAALSKH